MPFSVLMDAPASGNAGAPTGANYKNGRTSSNHAPDRYDHTRVSRTPKHVPLKKSKSNI